MIRIGLSVLANCMILRIFSPFQQCYLIKLDRQMNQQSFRKSSATRQILKQIFKNQHSTAPSTHRNNSLEVIKLNEAVAFLENKIERQYTEIKVLSEQLSKEISQKEELAELLEEEKNKSDKKSQQLAKTNKVNEELRKRMAKCNQQSKENSLKEDYEIKLNKYRDIVRKKDELLIKHQQKIEELLKRERQSIDLEQELKNFKESFNKLKNREQQQTIQIDSFKKKNNQLEQQLNQQKRQFSQQQQALMFAQQNLRRIKAEYDQLTQQFNQQMEKTKNNFSEMEAVINVQREQILKNKAKTYIEPPEWSLDVYRKDIKRDLFNSVKDPTLRKKVQKIFLNVLEVLQVSFSSILRQVIEN